jgi:hypothetical protein
MLRKHNLIARLLYKNVYLHEHTCTLHNSYHYNLFLLLLSILGDINHHRYMAATNIIYIKKFKKTYRRTVFILNRNTSEIQTNSESKKMSYQQYNIYTQYHYILLKVDREQLDDADKFLL